MAKLRVVIADDFSPFLDTLRSLLSAQFDIVAAAGCGKCALQAIRRHKPDVAVLDLSMPGLTGMRVVQELAADSHRPRIVICSMESDPDVIEAARQAGAAAYVVKSCLEKELIPALNSTVQSQVAV